MTDHELQQDINLALADDEQTLWGSRLVKKSLFDADGSTLGSIRTFCLSKQPVKISSIYEGLLRPLTED